MENKEAYLTISRALNIACMRDCGHELEDNCAHQEAGYWLTLLVQQIEGVNGNV